MATKNARRRIEEGHPRMRGSFTRLRRPREIPGSRASGIQRPASPVAKGVRFWRDLSGSLRNGLFLRRQTRRQRKRTTSSARSATIRCGRGYWRSRVCPYVESSLQKSVGGDGPKEAHIPDVLPNGKGWRERGSSPRKTILASHTRHARSCDSPEEASESRKALRGKPWATRSRKSET